MVRYAQRWPYMHRYGQICTDLARYAQIWPDTHRYGQICSDIARYASIWPDGQICKDMARYAQIWTDMHRYCQIYTDMARCASIWSDMHRDGHICIDMARYAQIWPDNVDSFSEQPNLWNWCFQCQSCLFLTGSASFMYQHNWHKWVDMKSHLEMEFGMYFVAVFCSSFCPNRSANPWSDTSVRRYGTCRMRK